MIEKSSIYKVNITSHTLYMNTSTIMLDKNPFEQDHLWQSFLTFSQDLWNEIHTHAEAQLAECEVVAFYPALDFILKNLSENFTFYNLPVNGIYEHFEGTIFDYAQQKLPKVWHLTADTHVLAYLSLIQDHQKSDGLNEQITYIILKQVEKDNKKVWALTSAKNFLEREGQQLFCSWDYLAEIVYLDPVLLSQGDENGIVISNWRRQFDEQQVIRTSDEEIAYITTIVSQFIHQIEHKQFKQMPHYIETR